MITKPEKNDLQYGRGYKIRTSAGNLVYRALINSVKPRFYSEPTSLKGIFAHQIVNHIRNLDPPWKIFEKRITIQILGWKCPKKKPSRK
jgi:hypothetical protein